MNRAPHSFFRALVLALPISIAFWLLLFWAAGRMMG